MQLPIDIRAALAEAIDVEAARREPLSVTIYIDESAPGDIQAHVRRAFASASETVRVSIIYLDGRRVEPYAGDDMVCLVAGLSESNGSVAAACRAAGVPCMVATTMPQLVFEIAHASGHDIPEADIVAPKLTSEVYSHVMAGGGNAPALRPSWGEPECPTEGDVGIFEPIELIEEACETLDARMGAWVVEACRRKRLAFAVAFPFVRHPFALEVVRATAMQNVGVSLLVFVPGADLPVMTLNQVKMLLQLAAAYDEALDASRIKELVALVGGAFACRSVARQVSGCVPGLGWAVKAAVGYTGTLAMGRAAIEYYEGAPNVSKLADAVGAARDRAVAAAAKQAGRQAYGSASQVAASVRDAAGDTLSGMRDAAGETLSGVRDCIARRKRGEASE